MVTSFLMCLMRKVISEHNVVMSYFKGWGLERGEIVGGDDGGKSLRTREDSRHKHDCVLRRALGDGYRERNE